MNASWKTVKKKIANKIISFGAQFNAKKAWPRSVVKKWGTENVGVNVHEPWSGSEAVAGASVIAQSFSPEGMAQDCSWELYVALFPKKNFQF